MKGGYMMSKVSVDKILDRIIECGGDSQIIQNMNLSYDVLFHVYSSIEEASLQGSALSLPDIFKIIYFRS